MHATIHLRLVHQDAFVYLSEMMQRFLKYCEWLCTTLADCTHIQFVL